MPIDKKHPPEFYPAIFREALFRTPGKGLRICLSPLKERCKTEARRFRAFIASCQEYPLSAEYKRLLFVVARTRISRVDNLNYACFVVVKEKLALEERINIAIDL